MALSEFELIARYFQQPGLAADDTHPNVALGIGDDCALLAVPPGQQLAVSLDVCVADVHFPANADPGLIAQRALAVNLSDLAAMGASPLGFTLGLTLPLVDEQWLQNFSTGLRVAAIRYRCPLLGGDTTRGSLQIAIQVHGTVPAGTALKRSGAREGDDVYVSGMLGRAGLALFIFRDALPGMTPQQRAELLEAYYTPVPRLTLGAGLRGVATAAQDVSDGLLADLGHIAQQSGVGIVVEATRVPVANVLRNLCTPAQALELALTAGDDYELVFTAAPGQRQSVDAAARTAGVGVTRIGHVCAGEGVSVVGVDGNALTFSRQGYDHFSGRP